MWCKKKDGFISADDSKVKVIVIPTNEELMIATDTKEIVEGGKTITVPTPIDQIPVFVKK